MVERLMARRGHTQRPASQGTEASVVSILESQVSRVTAKSKLEHSGPVTSHKHQQGEQENPYEKEYLPELSCTEDSG